MRVVPMQIVSVRGVSQVGASLSDKSGVLVAENGQSFKVRSFPAVQEKQLSLFEFERTGFYAKAS